MMMEELALLFENRVLGTSLLAWFIAQLLKALLSSVKRRRFDVGSLVGSGGMPSSHAAFVVSLAFSIGWQAGFDSALFALSAVFAMVVMYDAAGVRRAAGKQAQLLNQIVVEIFEEGHLPQYETLKELIGHTPLQVLAGAVLGGLVSILRVI